MPSDRGHSCAGRRANAIPVPETVRPGAGEPHQESAVARRSLGQNASVDPQRAPVGQPMEFASHVSTIESKPLIPCCLSRLRLEHHLTHCRWDNHQGCPTNLMRRDLVDPSKVISSGGLGESGSTRRSVSWVIRGGRPTCPACLVSRSRRSIERGRRFNARVNGAVRLTRDRCPPSPRTFSTTIREYVSRA
jgi:hypothetical protein